MTRQVVAIILGEFVLLGWVVWIVARRLREKGQLRAELHGRMIERFGSASELVAFLNTAAGRQFLDSLSPQGSTPLLRIIRSVQTGVVIAFVGVGLLILTAAHGTLEVGFLIAGVVTLTLGLGFLASAAVSYRLSKAWGLLGAAPQAMREA